MLERKQYVVLLDLSTSLHHTQCVTTEMIERPYKSYASIVQKYLKQNIFGNTHLFKI